MKRLLIAALLAVWFTTLAYSGTFVDDFNDGNLDGWHIRTAPLLRSPDTTLLKFEDGHLVIDPVFRGRKHSVYLELRTGNAEKWDSYTLTFRIRFERSAKAGRNLLHSGSKDGGSEFSAGRCDSYSG